MADRQDPIVGIDLGTTNSVVAIIVDGKPLVLDEAGEKLLPSVVGINPQGQLVTGVAARNQLAAFPDRTVASIKRQMGRMDPVALGDQTFTPPEISAMILRRLRDRASRAIGQPVNRAVITVPAFFDENQRQATREAAGLAGLTVERIINEPTAATLVYHAGSHDRKQIAVYDFGGGTFDVSIVRMEAGVIEVLSSRGDVHLGGDDLDQVLVNHVADQFQTEHGVDLRKNSQARYRLWLACEQAKRRLSTDETVEITEEFIAEKAGQPLHLTATVTREEFEELIEPFVARTIDSLDEALRESGLTIHQLDDLVLVGGSTRIPLVEARLREEFQREPSRAVDPDLAVALGAAVQAAMIDGRSAGPVLVDVTGHTLGIEACTEMTFAGPKMFFSPIIHRNTPLPARYEQAYSTLYDDQDAVDIHVLQGERPEVHRNQSIGKFRLELETGSGDRNKVVVRFDLTLDGILKVSATQSATGLSQVLTIQNALSQFQADDRDRAESRLKTMFDDSVEFLDEDDGPFSNEWQAEDSDGKDALSTADHASAEVRFPEAVAILKKADSLRASVEGQDAEDLELLCENLKQAMTLDDPAAVASLIAELDDLLFYVR
ncbi:Hsp70 family protein [Schlesneria paludicola]|uniref:Hsp70 family protein n=1 Tax=Schlesneria paludicola TaxID=360056 RepID=UPI00029A75ED|nr:Hsp70 family protein [Schlesneria paludicola]